MMTLWGGDVYLAPYPGKAGCQLTVVAQNDVLELELVFSFGFKFV
jgi:hypothetical protein